MKQLSDCCKAEIKLTGSPRHEDRFACVKCGRIIGTPIKKQKPKELDWEKTLHIEMVSTVADSLTAGITRPLGSDKSDITIKHFKEIKKLIKSLLTQQRTEIEMEKVKVVWNDVCEQIKQEARTELLEELKKEIGENRKGTFTDDGGNDCWYIEDLEKHLNSKITNLMEK